MLVNHCNFILKYFHLNWKNVNKTLVYYGAGFTVKNKQNNILILFFIIVILLSKNRRAVSIDSRQVTTSAQEGSNSLL